MLYHHPLLSWCNLKWLFSFLFVVFVVSNSHSSAFTFIFSFFPSLSDVFGDVCVCTDTALCAGIWWRSGLDCVFLSFCQSESELWSGRWWHSDQSTVLLLHSHGHCLSVSVIHEQYYSALQSKWSSSKAKVDKGTVVRIIWIHHAPREIFVATLMKELKRAAASVCTSSQSMPTDGAS